jgi:hypothetical protein
MRDQDALMMDDIDEFTSAIFRSSDIDYSLKHSTQPAGHTERGGGTKVRRF